MVEEEIIEIVELTKNDKEKWDEFVDSSVNGTIFHKMEFLEYHDEGRFDFKFIGFYKKSKPIAMLSFETRNGMLKSPVGASYGGPIFTECSFRTKCTVINSLKKWCYENNLTSINIIQAPIIYNKRLGQDLDFAYLYSGFSNSINLFSSALDLNYFSEKDPLNNFSAAGKRAVKKSFNQNVTTVIDSDRFADYYEILAINKRKFDVTPAHTLDELIYLKNKFKDKITLFAVEKDKELLGGILAFECNSNTLLCFYIASLPEHQSYRPINRVLYDVTLWAKKKGFKFLDLGVSMNTQSDNVMEPAWNLISFKEHNGSRGFLRPTYTFENNN